jgi:hypothetical protein
MSQMALSTWYMLIAFDLILINYNALIYSIPLTAGENVRVDCVAGFGTIVKLIDDAFSFGFLT